LLRRFGWLGIAIDRKGDLKNGFERVIKLRDEINRHVLAQYAFRTNDTVGGIFLKTGDILQKTEVISGKMDEMQDSLDSLKCYSRKLNET